MCGIAGIASLSGCLRNDFPDLLNRLSNSLELRGPDAEGSWTSTGRAVALANRRLAIQDLDTRANQPMRSADGRFVLVFNGELYNPAELRAELEGRGHVFVTTSDTEVLLRMYTEHGTAMLNRLRGMYAFAVWDEAEQQLTIARDPLGIKPLYYAIGDGHFYFASQVRSLRGIPGLDFTAEPAGHVGFLVWGSVPEPYTFYRGIRCLPSGSFLTIAKGTVGAPKRFGSPAQEFACFDDADRPKSQEESNERLRAALTESVRTHLIADVPVSLFLSAGLDSGIIAALASEAHGGLEGLTLGFDRMKGTTEDEIPLAAQVAGQYGIRHYARYIDQKTFVEHRERMLDLMDQPTIDGVNTYFVSLLARERGYKVALSGLGGDELFGGYPSFRQVPALVHRLGDRGRLQWMGAGLRAIAAPVLKRFTSPKYAGLFEYGGSWGGAYLLRRGLFMPWETAEILGGETARDGWEELASIQEMNLLAAGVDDGRLRGQEDFLRVSALETHYYMRTQLLRDADWAGMAHSIEIRVPMVDMALLRQIAALRASEFAPRKPQVANVLRRPLPERVVRRQKSGFVAPVREWLQEEADHAPQRGLRQWAKYIHRRFAGLPVGEAASHAVA